MKNYLRGIGSTTLKTIGLEYITHKDEKQEIMFKHLREYIEKFPIGKTGYICITDYSGNIIIGEKNKKNKINYEKFKISSLKNGSYLKEAWIESQTTKKREKLTLIYNYQELNYLVMLVVYRDEFLNGLGKDFFENEFEKSSGRNIS